MAPSSSIRQTRALLELDRAARAAAARRQLAQVGLVADQRDAPVALRVRLDRFEDRLVPAARRQRFDFRDRGLRLKPAARSSAVWRARTSGLVSTRSSTTSISARPSTTA